MIDLLHTSTLIGLGVSMDACAISVANCINSPHLKKIKFFCIPIIFALFHTLFPLLGYLIGLTFLNNIQELIPWIALIILTGLGLSMILNKKNPHFPTSSNLTWKMIFLQALATSIDTISIGVSISNYTFFQVLFCIAVIGIISFIMCFVGQILGKRFGIALNSLSEKIGGIILIIVGLIIFIKGTI